MRDQSSKDITGNSGKYFNTETDYSNFNYKDWGLAVHAFKQAKPVQELCLC